MDSKEDSHSLNTLEQCPNCDFSPLPQKSKYCPSCGQNCKERRITVWSLFKEAFANIFNLDNKLWQTTWNLFIPGRLTKEFFAGRRKRYISPVRIFFITALTFFAVIQLMTANLFDGNKKKSDVFLEQLQKESNKIKVDSTLVLESNLVLDTLYQRMSNHFDNPLNISFNLGDLIENDSLELSDEQTEALKKINGEDFVTSASTNLLEKYSDGGFWENIISTQINKLTESGANFWSYLLGKLVWMMLLMMPFLAMFLKLLYIRRGIYYVDHLIFSFHAHAFTFLIFSILLLLEKYLPEGISAASGFIFLGLFIYFFMAMKNFYGQSKKKTFLKLFLFSGFYVFLLTLAITFTTLISALAY